MDDPAEATSNRDARAAALLFAGPMALAFALRVAFVTWAPGIPGADGYFYHLHGQAIADGLGYVNLDGSPAIRWMPGWPHVLGALYALFGSRAGVAMAANAVFDAATAGVLASLGARLFDRRTGAIAGVLYALWPGAIYYAATVFAEPLFNLLLVSTLHLLVCAAGATSRRVPRFALAGLALGLCVLVKAEPQALAPVLLLFLWKVSPSPRAFGASAVALFAVAGAVLAPWAVRNYLAFDRLIPTSANGGIALQLANRPGATGSQAFLANRDLARRYRRATDAQTTLARNDAGLREAARFAREHPSEQLRIALAKLRTTYGGDSQGARTAVFAGFPPAWHVPPATFERLARVADAYWFAMLALAGLGALTAGSWRPGTAPLVLGLVATWFCLHLVFLGGQRYHVPELPAFALLAARGTVALGARVTR